MTTSPAGSDNPFVAGMALLAEASNLGLTRRLDATAMAYQALHTFERVPTRRGQAAAHLLIGQLAFYTQDLGEARDHLTAARDLFAAAGVRSGQAEAGQTLGQVFVRLEDYAAARTEFTAALALLTEDGDERGVATAHRHLGSLERRDGSPQLALTHYQEAESRFGALGDVAGMASVRLSLGNLLTAMGSTHRAMAAYQAAAELFEQAEDPLGEANAVRFYGDAARRAGQLDTARDAYRHALATYVALEDHLGESFVTTALGELADAAGDTGDAAAHLERAAELFAQANDPLRLVTAVEAVAAVRLKEDDKLAALTAMADGVASARLAARWSPSPELSERTEAAIDDLEARALDLALDLGEGALAGAVIESGVAGLVGLLPLLLDGPPSPDERTEELRRRLRELAEQLRTPPQGSAPAEDGPPQDDDSPPTRSGRDAGPGGDDDRARVVAELEGLLGRRAREVVAPARTDYARLLSRASRRRVVVQYSCPRGIGAGHPLYVVWSAAGGRPEVSRTLLSDAAANRLAVLTGTRLVAEGPDDDVTEIPPEAMRARGLGVRAGDAAGLAEARRIARRTNELWSHLDRDPRSDPAVDDLAEALFPAGLVDLLRGAVDPTTGVPARVLIVPGTRLWNLPWAGMPVAGTGRRLIQIARVSLTPSLSSCRPEPDAEDSPSDWTRPAWSETRGGRPMAIRRADLPSVAAWIPEGAVKGTVVERAMVGAVFGPEALTGNPQEFLTRLATADAAIASVHGQSETGLAHGVFLAPGRSLSAADLIGLELPATFVIGACWSARVDPDAHAEPFALPLIALARGVDHLIGGTYPLPDAPPFPTARLLTQLYPALLGTDPATALWLAQHEASDSGAAPHTWAGLTHTTALA